MMSQRCFHACQIEAILFSFLLLFFLRKVHRLGHSMIIWDVGHDLCILTYPEAVQKLDNMGILQENEGSIM